METSSNVGIPPARECFVNSVADIFVHNSANKAPVQSTKNNVNEKNSHRSKKNRNECLDAIVEVSQLQDAIEIMETQELLIGHRDKRMEVFQNNLLNDDEWKIKMVTVKEDNQATALASETDLNDAIQNPRLMKKMEYSTCCSVCNQRIVKILLFGGIGIFWTTFLIVLIYGLYATS